MQHERWNGYGFDFRVWRPRRGKQFLLHGAQRGHDGRMFPSANSSPTINGTLMMTYAGKQRLTNHYTTSTIQNGMTVNSDFYFDQATGMMVQWRQETIQTSGTLQTNDTQMMKITESSVWSIPEFPSSIVAPLIVLGIIPVATALISKRRAEQHPK